VVRLPAGNAAWRDGRGDAAGGREADRRRCRQPHGLCRISLHEVALMNKPVVAMTFGDASGIGPELVAKLLSRPVEAAQIVLVGDPWVWAEGQRIAGVAPPVRIIRDWVEARHGDGAPMMLDLSTVAKADIVP